MPTTMTASFKVDTSGFGATAATRSVRVEALDRVEVTVPARSGAGDGTVTVDVQPGESGQTRLVFITASAYPEDGGTPQLTFTVDGSAEQPSLDGPLLLAGSAVGDLLGAVKRVEFTNASAADVAVQVLVGRDATP